MSRRFELRADDCQAQTPCMEVAATTDHNRCAAIVRSSCTLDDGDAALTGRWAGRSEGRQALLTGHLRSAADVTVLERLLPPGMTGRTRPLTALNGRAEPTYDFDAAVSSPRLDSEKQIARAMRATPDICTAERRWSKYSQSTTIAIAG